MKAALIGWPFGIAGLLLSNKLSPDLIPLGYYFTGVIQISIQSIAKHIITNLERK